MDIMEIDLSSGKIVLVMTPGTLRGGPAEK